MQPNKHNTHQPNKQTSKLFSTGLIVATVILILDQVSKWWIVHVYDLPAKESVTLLPFLNFTMVWNKGISMGMLQAETDLARWGLIIGTGAVIILVLLWLKKAERQLEAIALAAVLGGAIGNLIDRFVYGAVADFVHLHAWGYSFYVFNVADAAISLGVVALIIDSFISERLRGDDKNTKTSDSE